MDNIEYFKILKEDFDRINGIANNARSKGFDPAMHVEVKEAPTLAARVEGIIGLKGLEEIINSRAEGKSRQELAFEIVKEICINPKFEMDLEKRLTLSVRVGLSILTEGILVAPTEGISSIKLRKSKEGSDYIAIIYAGPIRGAGGTGAALSVALADYARRIFKINDFKISQSEISRYLEEINLYHTRVTLLQYPPHEDEIRTVLSNCPVCIDGVPTEDIEVSIHRNLKYLDSEGKEENMTNRIRGGIGLVLCEGVIQKAKNVLKYTRMAGIEWTWLNEIIKVDKPASSSPDDKKGRTVFLEEVIAGRPILAYPNHKGAFRLRYGRSRFSGIAAKGFNPATMLLLNEFIAVGTQVKVEKPGKGCIATPVDSIEGPFVKLKDGRAFRINDAKTAIELQNDIIKIISVGDILITIGDFKKTNTPLLPTSYVEEYWNLQIKAAGYKEELTKRPSFEEAATFSKKYNIPIHPEYLFEYQDIDIKSLERLAISLNSSLENLRGKSLNEIESLVIIDAVNVRNTIETLCIPHHDLIDKILIEKNYAQSLISTFGMLEDEIIIPNSRLEEACRSSEDVIIALNKVSPFKIMQRSTRIGGRIGRPEKAKERMMKPAINALFPIGEYGGKERNIYKVYMNSIKSLKSHDIEVEMARFRCITGGEPLHTYFCKKHNSRAVIKFMCQNCGRNYTETGICSECKGKVTGNETRMIQIINVIDGAKENINIQVMPTLVKGVKGMFNKTRAPEPLEKGILRALNGVYVFKDGTCRFDATDVPITHFYPKEMGVSVEKLNALGYDKDYLGNPLLKEDQLVELKHQDVILNYRGAEYFLKVSKFMDSMLARFYKMERFYNLEDINGLIGHYVVTLAPHISAGVLSRIIGFTDANVGFAHPYLVCARRRNCDGDEDATMLLLDALINFSPTYLPTSVGGTMDAPIILSVHVIPEEVDDEVHSMEIAKSYPIEFYESSYSYSSASKVAIESVVDRLKKPESFCNLNFTHSCSMDALIGAPKKSMYTKLNNMQDKIRVQFELMDKLYSIDKSDSAKRLIMGHFIPDLMGNMHSFSKQTFRCVNCNFKYRRPPLVGKCTNCGGKIVLTISKGGVEKYLNMAITLAERYDIDAYIKQTIYLLKNEIEKVFSNYTNESNETKKQTGLSRFM